MWSGNFKAAVASLRQAKWRTTFTMLGIIIGITSVVTIVSLGEGFKHQIIGQVDSLGSDVLTIRSGKLITKGQSGDTLNLLSLLSASTLTTNDVDSLGKLPSVNAVAPLSFVTSSASGDTGSIDNVFIAGTNDQLPELLHQKIVYGGFFPEDDSGQAIAVIGPLVAKKIFSDSNPVGHTITINGQGFIVHGVFEPSAGGFLSVAQADLNSAIFIPMGAAADVTGGHTNILQIFIRSRGNIDQTQADAVKVLAHNHGQQDFTVLRQKELLDVASGLLNSATGFISAIAAISLLVGGIGIMDIMLVSVSERNREIGIRKAIGATNRQILMQFLTEGLVLTVGGGLIGILVSLALNQLLRLYTSWRPIINIPVLILAVAVSVTIGLIFSIAPAFKAARKEPIQALRGD